MRAKRIIAPVLSLALCAGQFSAAAASAADISASGADLLTYTDKTDTASQQQVDIGSSAVTSANSEELRPPSVIKRSIITIKLGDVNNDDLIDANDASAILKAYTKISNSLDSGLSPSQTVAADINMDSHVDSIDASGILSYYSYISTNGTLSIEEFMKKDSQPPVTTTTTTAVPKTTTTTAAHVTTTAAPKITTVTAPPTTTTTSVPVTTTTTAAPVTTSTSSASSSTTTTTATAAPVTSTTVTTTYQDPYKVQAIQLSKTEMTLNIGEGGGISYVTMLPLTVTDYRDIWSCSDEKVAIVDNEGWIFPLSEGECIVTVQSINNPAVTAHIKVTVKDPNKVNTIKLSKSEITVPVGGGDISYVTMLPANATNKKERWVSSDPTVATVNEEGWIVGKSEGKCTVTVYSLADPNVYAAINVTVTDPNKVTAIRLSKSEIALPVGGSDVSYVTMLPANAANKSELWSSSDTSVATVSEDGTITGISEGTCIVTVYSRSNPNVHASVNVTVTDPAKVREIKLSKYEMNILVGTNDISYVTMLPKTALNVEEVWTSSNPAIASVDRWGNVYGVSAGSCIVTVISKANPSVKADINVTVHNKPIIVTSSTATTTVTTSTATTTTTTTAQPVTPPAQHLVQTINGATYIDGIIVVNKTYGLPENFAVTELNPLALSSFNKLSSDAALLGLNIRCSSGFRSYATQQTLYNNYVASDGAAAADTYSARPGHSEHQTGLAIDVNSISDDFLGTPECEWLAKNAHRYGFIIRYPKGKEDKTGYRYEPWHIRYLGVETATAVYNSGLCLEEYLGIDSVYK